MRNLFLIAAVAGLSAPALAGSATLILDDFDSEPNDEAGGPRQVWSTVLANPLGQASNFDVDTAFSAGGVNGAAFFNAGIGVKQEGTIAWNGGITGLNLDAVALGITGFELDFAAIDQDFDFVMRLFDGSGGTASAAGTFLAGGARTESLALSGFGSASFDATEIDSIEIVFNVSGSTASLDFALTEFRAAIPAPGPLAMIGLGGLVAARRRR